MIIQINLFKQIADFIPQLIVKDIEKHYAFVNDKYGISQYLMMQLISCNTD